MRSTTQLTFWNLFVARVSPNIVAIFAMRVGFVLLEFGCGVILARILKATSYGVYAFVMSCVGLLAVPAAVGFDRLLVREVSTLAARSEWGLLHGLIRHASTVVIAVSVGLGLTIAVAVTWVGASSADMNYALLAGASLIPFVAYARMRQAVLQGLGRVILGQAPEMLAQPMTVLLIASSAYLLTGLPRTGAQALLIQLCGAGIACAIGLFALRRALPSQVHTSIAEFRSSQWTLAAMPFVWLLGLNVVLMNVDTVIVGLLQTPKDAGIYRTASQMSAFVAFPLAAANAVAAPLIAVLYGRGDIKAMKARARETTFVALAGALPIAAMLIAFGRPILLMFGADFAAGYRALVILTLGYLISAAMGVAGYVLIMTKFERAAVWSYLLAACVDIVLTLALVPHWGIDGAAVATALSIVLLNLLMSGAARRRVWSWSARAPRE